MDSIMPTWDWERSNTLTRPQGFPWYADLPSELQRAVLATALSTEHCEIDWDPYQQNQVRCKIPVHAIFFALASRATRLHSMGAIATMICRHDARPNTRTSQLKRLHGIKTVMLDEGCSASLDTWHLPNLHTLIIEGFETYQVDNLDLEGKTFSDFSQPAALMRQKADIEQQLTLQLPQWIQATLSSSEHNIEVKITLHLNFSEPVPTQASAAWNADTTYPDHGTSLSCRYCCRSGRVYDVRSNVW